ncbi:MAG: hypothetical protein J5817_03330 [Treponema sp.]|nr:hypothetical protein [Treponema sp.]
MRKGFVFLSVLILLSTRTFALKDYSKISPRIHRMIVATIKETQANIYDYNLDGEINCRDYSCVFKVTWDRLYPKEAYRCTLVRNSPPYGNGHLFVNIEDDNSCPIDVEPQAHSPQHYLMYETWTAGEFSNQAYNAYGETEYWLAEPQRLANVLPNKSSGGYGYGYYSNSSYSNGSYSNNSYANSSNENVLLGYFSVGYMGSLDLKDSSDSGFLNSQKCGIEFAYETPAYQDGFFAVFAFDYVCDEAKAMRAVLTGMDFGYCFLPIFQPYVGCFGGIKWYDDFYWGDIGFAWKVCAGSRFTFSSFCVRAEVSYGSILGPTGMVSLGIGF